MIRACSTALGRSRYYDFDSFASLFQSPAATSWNYSDRQGLGDRLRTRQVWPRRNYLPGRSAGQLRSKINFRRLWL